MRTCGDRNCIFERRTQHSEPRCSCTRGMTPTVRANVRRMQTIAATSRRIANEALADTAAIRSSAEALAEQAQAEDGKFRGVVDRIHGLTLGRGDDRKRDLESRLAQIEGICARALGIPTSRD